MKELPYAIAISGASGSLYALRLLQVLLALGKQVELTVSPAAIQVFEKEVDLKLELKGDVAQKLLHRLQEMPLLPEAITGAKTTKRDISSGKLNYFQQHDFSAGIASGSFRTAGMVICPCSMGTLSAIANGLSTNLMQRAADVHLKERRKLILVPRETPLGLIQLDNMKRIIEAGGIVLPAMPGFYHQPRSIMDLVDFVVNRICDQLGLEISLTSRWGDHS